MPVRTTMVPRWKRRIIAQTLVHQFPDETEQQGRCFATEGPTSQICLPIGTSASASSTKPKAGTAAGLYVRRRRRKVQDTTLVRRLELRVAALAEMGAEPAEPAVWFVEMFPDSKAAKPLISTTTR